MIPPPDDYKSAFRNRLLQAEMGLLHEWVTV